MLNAFNQCFKAFIENNHLNLTSIAREMGLNNANKLHAIAKGQRNMTVDELKRFCEVVHIETNDLINYEA